MCRLSAWLSDISMAEIMLGLTRCFSSSSPLNLTMSPEISVYLCLFLFFFCSHSLSGPLFNILVWGC